MAIFGKHYKEHCLYNNYTPPTGPITHTGPPGMGRIQTSNGVGSPRVIYVTKPKYDQVKQDTDSGKQCYYFDQKNNNLVLLTPGSNKTIQEKPVTVTIIKDQDQQTAISTASNEIGKPKYKDNSTHCVVIKGQLYTFEKTGGGNVKPPNLIELVVLARPRAIVTKRAATKPGPLKIHDGKSVISLGRLPADFALPMGIKDQKLVTIRHKGQTWNINVRNLIKRYQNNNALTTAHHLKIHYKVKINPRNPGGNPVVHASLFGKKDRKDGTATRSQSVTIQPGDINVTKANPLPRVATPLVNAKGTTPMLRTVYAIPMRTKNYGMALVIKLKVPTSPKAIGDTGKNLMVLKPKGQGVKLVPGRYYKVSFKTPVSDSYTDYIKHPAQIRLMSKGTTLFKNRVAGSPALKPIPAKVVSVSEVDDWNDINGF